MKDLYISKRDPDKFLNVLDNIGRKFPGLRVIVKPHPTDYCFSLVHFAGAPLDEEDMKFYIKQIC